MLQEKGAPKQADILWFFTSSELWCSMCYTGERDIWTIPRSRLISWLGEKIKAGQLTWCEGQGWVWHTPLTYIYGRKWTLGRSKLITWHSSPVCPISLSLVWNVVEETTRIYAGLFGNTLSKFNSELNGKKTFETSQKQCLLWEQVSNFTFC